MSIPHTRKVTQPAIADADNEPSHVWYSPCTDDMALELRDIKSCMLREIKRLDQFTDGSISQTNTWTQRSWGYSDDKPVQRHPSPYHCGTEKVSEVYQSALSIYSSNPLIRRSNLSNFSLQSDLRLRLGTKRTLKSKETFEDFVNLAKEQSSITTRIKRKTFGNGERGPLEGIDHVDSISSENATQQWRRLLDRCCRTIKDHKQDLMDMFMGFVIVTNSFTIGISLDHGSTVLWTLVEGIYALVYLMEFVFKFNLLGCNDFFWGDDKHWNIFEFALLALAWIELGSALISLLFFASTTPDDSMDMLILTRMFKLVRVARIVRVIRLELFKQLFLMISGALGGINTLFWSCVLIFWPLYIGSLIFRQTLGDYTGQYFSTVPMAFFTMFRCFVPGECTDEQGRPLFHLIQKNNGWGYAIAYMALVMIMQFGLFNVIVALFVENVVVAAKSDGERVRKDRLRNQEFFNTKMFELLRCLWSAHVEMCRDNGTPVDDKRETPQGLLKSLADVEITGDLFTRFLQYKKVKEVFQDLDVVEDDQLSLFQILDVDESGTLELPELYEGISKLRGPARRSDLICHEMLLRRILQELANEDEDDADGNGVESAQAV